MARGGYKHVANPGTAESEEHLIGRRPFNYANGVSKAGQRERGVRVRWYQANLQTGFLSVRKRLDGEPLEEYIKPIGGGYFFTLPGIRDKNDWIGRTLMEASSGSTRS